MNFREEKEEPDGGKAPPLSFGVIGGSCICGGSKDKASKPLRLLESMGRSNGECHTWDTL